MPDIPEHAWEYNYNRYTYAVWLEDDGSWSWHLVGDHWKWLQEAGNIDIIEGHGLGTWTDACEEAKRVLQDELA